MKPIIVSFYTDDHKYPKWAARLKAQCNALGLEHDIRQVKSERDWLKNTCKKPAFIAEMMDKHRRPIMWVDVDCSVLQEPTAVYGATEDVGFVPMPKKSMRPWYVGVMWFNYTTEARNLVDRWVSATGDCSDHSAFFELGEAGGLNGVRIRTLPAEYCSVGGDLSKVVILIGLSDWEVKHRQLAKLKAQRGY